MSSAVICGAAVVTSNDGTTLSSGSPPKIVVKSVRNMDSTGAGMFRVGENTIPTVCI